MKIDELAKASAAPIVTCGILTGLSAAAPGTAPAPTQAVSQLRSVYKP